MTSEIKWNDRYNIGVETVDKAHRKLFSIVRKMVILNNDETDREWICREGIKYFKSYVLKHFSEEEAYMRSIHYSGYAAHKCVHDDMKNDTLPELENEMKESNYSVESVQHFLGICIGWLNHHILLEDRAITGKIPNKWTQGYAKDTSFLEENIVWVMRQLFNLNMHTVSHHYAGENFGRKICYRLSYSSPDGTPLHVYFILEEHLVLEIVSRLLNVQFIRIDKTALGAVRLISQQFMKQVAKNCDTAGHYVLEQDHLLTEEQLERDFDKQYPAYSFLFNTGTGYFALCIRT